MMAKNHTNSPPLFTIGVTCFNAAGTIDCALASAQAQTWPNFEIVVVDDCSTDDSPGIVRSLAADDPRIRLVRHDINRGVAAARNTILAQARGEFIAFFDDDDESVPDRVTRQYERIVDYEAASGAGLIICHTARIQKMPNGAERYEGTLNAGDDLPAPHGEAVAQRILIGRPLWVPSGSMATCSQMARIATYGAVGGFDESLRRSEDSDLDVRLALKDAHFVGISEPLVRQTITVSAEKTIDEERRFALNWLTRHKGYLEKIGWWEHAWRWLDIKFDYLAGRRARFSVRMALLSLRFPIKTAQRIYWTLPNRHHGRAQAALYRDHRPQKQ